jgi:cytochrome c-type biogenesis protein CcmF
VLAILGTFLVRSGILNSIHAFGASTLGIPFLILHLRPDRGLDALVRRARATALRAPARLAALARGGLPAQQPRARRALLRVFWGTFFPLISEAVTGTQASVGPPWFDRYIVAAGAAARAAARGSGR